jgi:hypothetical protein
MRPVEHFLSQLSANKGTEGQIAQGFTDLTAPVIGRAAAEDLCGLCLERFKERPGTGGPPCIRLGYVAAFILGEFDDSMELEAEEWDAIRDTLEDAAGEMDLKTLTALMGELLERGKL